MIRRAALSSCVVLICLSIAACPAWGRWYLEKVDTTGNVGEYTSLALDSGGEPHISYYDGIGLALKHAHKVAGTWTIELVDQDGNVGQYTSLALESSGYPCISYYQGGGDRDLKYAYEDIGGWSIDTVDSDGNVGQYTSLALDSSGYPHISYYDAANPARDLRYAYKDAVGWHIDTVETAGIVGQYTSLVLDGSGYPHISYYDAGANLDLKYAYRDVSGWHIDTVDQAGDVGQYTSIALDGNGYPHITYWDAGNGDLKYAYQDVSGWNIEIVDTMFDVGQYTSLALDVNGYPRVSYHDADSLDLKYAYKDTTWHIERVDRVDYVGEYTSLALDSGGYPHISYYDGTGLDLKYAFQALDDVGVDSILAPPDTVIADSVYWPRAKVENFGQVFTDTFDVSCLIDSSGMVIYGDTTVGVILAPGDTVSVPFDSLAVPSADSTTYTMTVVTLLPSDENPQNDTLSKFIFAYHKWRDVGVDTILAPPDMVVAGSLYTPIARVENYGDFTETDFDVECRINSGVGNVYLDTFTVTSLAPAGVYPCSFQIWTVPPTDSVTYTMKVTTLLAGDERPENDTLSKFILAYREWSDVGVDSILSPPDTLVSGSNYVPVARVENFGPFFTDTFDVSCVIDSSGALIYVDTTFGVILDPGDTASVRFDTLTVPPSDSTTYTITVRTLLDGDLNPQNDALSKSMFAYVMAHDVGPDWILSPPDTVVSGSNYVPVARVENFGQFFTDTFDVSCLIDSSGTAIYGDTTFGVILDPGDTVSVSFDQWPVPPWDSISYGVRVVTLLDNDGNPGNDTLSKSVFAYGRAHDVGPDSILSPPDTVVSGSDYVPRSRIENFSQFFTDTFDVSCLIDSSGNVIYGDTTSGVILDPGDTVSVSFDQWPVPPWDSISYGVTFVTLLANDANTQNDTLSKSVFAHSQQHDVGVDSIIAPADSVAAGSAYAPIGGVKNFGGSFTETFDVTCLIDSSGVSIYGDTITVVDLAPSETSPCTFSVWTVPLWDSVTYVITFETILAGDAYADNDTLSKQILAHVVPPEDIIFYNYPNPFDVVSVTTLKYCLPYDAVVSINVYDVSLECVKELVAEEAAQTGRVMTHTWSGEDHNGSKLANGVYIAELIAKRGGSEDRKFRRIAIFSE